MTITSTATVATDRAARYGKQLTSHLGRRSVATWDEAGAHGTLDMSEGAATADLRSTATALVITLTTSADSAATYEDVIGRHLVRFGHRDELVVNWTRSDGTPGTTQVYDADQTHE
ncbi:DUF2218 domain-containing protein [Nocardia macrotermitis]|uniref:DUF2218 domain-containing protein n=1 Tax=Nocardia macrotermitis TaxID=2585198 RepID=A0A7K0D6Q1_9NOCA|nr:DUF2218 domain-containing protein [Nocardia macrotermitis]MQY21423.1 hypothetical protein [Nocardia macrotermitis]